MDNSNVSDKGKIIVLVIIILLALYAGGASYFYIKASKENTSMERRLKDLNQKAKDAERKVEKLSLEKQNIIEDNERLKTQAILNLDRQRQVAKDWEKDKNRLAEEEEKTVELEQELKKAKEELSGLRSSEKDSEQLKRKINRLESEKKIQEIRIEELKETLASNQERLKKEKVLFHYNLGVAYTQAGDYEAAISEYEKALKIDPDDANSHYNLGIIYDDYRKDPQKAIAHYQRFLELNPDFEDYYEVQIWIETLISQMETQTQNSIWDEEINIDKLGQKIY